jgi:hypothetical protein
VASLCEEISEWQEKLKTGDAPSGLAPPQIRACGQKKGATSGPG